MKLKRLTLVTLLIFAMTTFIVGCSDEKEKETPTTETTEIATTTKEPETTTEEITTEEPTTEYVYIGEELIVYSGFKDYFDGLILEKGDVIYINEIVPEESSEYDGVRGSLANSLLIAFKMDEEDKVLKDKYWIEGAYMPEIPYSDNYTIEYTGEKIKFVFAENYYDSVCFDVMPVE